MWYKLTMEIRLYIYVKFLWFCLKYTYCAHSFFVFFGNITMHTQIIILDSEVIAMKTCIYL